jgi:putative transposase
MKKWFTEAQLVGFLREVDAGVPVKDLCRKHGFSEASYDLWRSTFGGVNVSNAKRLKELELESTRLKKLLAGALLEHEVTREVLRNKWCAQQSGARCVGDDHARIERAQCPVAATATTTP